MALDYRILSAKPYGKFEDKDGNTVEAFDLFRKTFNDEQSLDGLLTYVEVTKEYIGRPDLVSLAVYGTDEYADILCKLNGISNPFELNTGMILECPVQQILAPLANLMDDPVEGFIEDEDNDSFTKTKDDYKKTKNEKRSPNEATVFDHNYVISDDQKYLFY